MLSLQGGPATEDDCVDIRGTGKLNDKSDVSTSMLLLLVDSFMVTDDGELQAYREELAFTGKSVGVDGELNDDISSSMPLSLVDSFKVTDGELIVLTVCVEADREEVAFTGMGGVDVDREKLFPEAKCKYLPAVD